MSRGTGRLVSARLPEVQATRTRALIFGVAALAVVALSQFVVASARAEVVDPNQVTGLTVTQDEGFATLGWTPVAGATDYQIERTPVDAANVPTGAAAIVGVWQAQRTITPVSPRFAEAGFALGGRYQWRVRARFGSTAQLYSEPVFGTTRPQWGTGPGADMRTQWESSGNATYTSDVNEYAYEAALDAASDRVRMVEIGRTNAYATGSGAPGNRPINLLIIGYPSPPATAAAISNGPAIVYNCNVHGDEPQGRESCLIFARMLAFTEDPHLLEVLANTTVLIVPAINGNGRARNQRGNETGADLNRDHLELLQPETTAYARMLRDYTPEVGVDLHEGDTEDLPILTARHLNVAEPLFREGKYGLHEGWLYEHAALSGWWHGPYSTGGDSHEGILRNTTGLKNAVGLLAENRPSGGTTRPAEGTQLANRNRKSYGSLYEEFQVLEYYWQRRAIVHDAVEQSIAAHKANVPPLRPFAEAIPPLTGQAIPSFAFGKLVLRGSYPWVYNPLNGANTGLPDVDTVTLARTLVAQPCGYFVTEALYSGPIGGPTLAVRLDAHGVAQETRASGHIVRMAQPLRGLIPMIFDAASVSPSPIVVGTRLTECPYVTATERSYSKTLLEGQTTSDTLKIGNIAPEVNEPLNWTITEAVSSCATPSDLPWVSTSATSGSVASAGGSQDVSVDFNTAGISGNTAVTGVLCLASNDAGEALITIPVSLTIRSLRDDIAAVRAAAASHSPLAETHANKALIAALQALDNGLSAGNWGDGVRPTTTGGRTVFDALVRAVKELNKIGEPWSQPAVDSLVAAGREISAVAIGEAPAGPNTDKAVKEQQRGDQLVNAETKLESYRKAWAFVREA